MMILERHCTLKSLDDVDAGQKVTLTGMESGVGKPYRAPVQPLLRVDLQGSDVASLLVLMRRQRWRGLLESKMRAVAEDEAGVPFLFTDLPLTSFLEQFCMDGRDGQAANALALVDRLREQLHGWSDAGADAIAFCFHQRSNK